MFTAITFIFCILGARFFYVQVVWGGQLGYRALDQWMREIPVVAERGLITDRNGVVLAENNTSYTVFARSNAVKDKEKTAWLLADALGADGDTLLKKLNSVKASEITVARHVDKSAVEKLAAESPDGVYYSRDNTRIYPKGDALCQVLGFTSTDNSGTTGIEKYYNKYLSGKNGELLYETDLVGINLEGAVAAYPSRRGRHERAAHRGLRHSVGGGKRSEKGGGNVFSRFGRMYRARSQQFRDPCNGELSRL